jgi:hypothetical protein
MAGCAISSVEKIHDQFASRGGRISMSTVYKYEYPIACRFPINTRLCQSGGIPFHTIDRRRFRSLKYQIFEYRQSHLWYKMSSCRTSESHCIPQNNIAVDVVSSLGDSVRINNAKVTKIMGFLEVLAHKYREYKVWSLQYAMNFI